MIDPLEKLLVESEGIFLVQAGVGEPVSWYGTLVDAEDEAEIQAIALGKTVYVFRAISKVTLIDSPVEWTQLAGHGPSIDDRT